MSENKVRFCNKCVESNQRFMTSAQHNLTDNKQNSFIDFDESISTPTIFVIIF